MLSSSNSGTGGCGFFSASRTACRASLRRSAFDGAFISRATRRAKAFIASKTGSLFGPRNWARPYLSRSSMASSSNSAVVPCAKDVSPAGCRCAPSPRRWWRQPSRQATPAPRHRGMNERRAARRAGYPPSRRAHHRSRTAPTGPVGHRRAPPRQGEKPARGHRPAGTSSTFH